MEKVQAEVRQKMAEVAPSPCSISLEKVTELDTQTKELSKSIAGQLSAAYSVQASSK